MFLSKRHCFFCYFWLRPKKTMFFSEPPDKFSKIITFLFGNHFFFPSMKYFCSSRTKLRQSMAKKMFCVPGPHHKFLKKLKFSQSEFILLTDGSSVSKFYLVPPTERYKTFFLPMRLRQKKLPRTALGDPPVFSLCVCVFSRHRHSPPFVFYLLPV
jgi:hypothetical protein